MAPIFTPLALVAPSIGLGQRALAMTHPSFICASELAAIRPNVGAVASVILVFGEGALIAASFSEQ